MSPFKIIGKIPFCFFCRINCSRKNFEAYPKKVVKMTAKQESLVYGWQSDMRRKLGLAAVLNALLIPFFVVSDCSFAVIVVVLGCFFVMIVCCPCYLTLV